MINEYYRKTKKSFEKKHKKDFKVFLKNKKCLRKISKFCRRRKRKKNISIIVKVINIFLKHKREEITI